MAVRGGAYVQKINLLKYRAETHNAANVKTFSLTRLMMRLKQLTFIHMYTCG